jgi:glycine dehydrogenase subunit 2
MIQIDEETKSDPDYVTSAPHDTFYKRLDEVGANRRLNLRWTDDMAEEPVAAD